MCLFVKIPKCRPENRLLKKRRFTDRTPKILITAGVLSILTAGVMVGYSSFGDYLAGQRAQAVLEQVRAESPASISVSTPSPADGSVLPDEYDSSAVDYTIGTETHPVTTEALDPPESPVPEKSIEPEPRYETIGVLSIPKLALELPVLSEYSDIHLKVSVCRYEGEAPENSERLVVAGHNYKSHFGKLPGLTPGDEVFFQNNGGELYNYTVTEITSISMYDHEALDNGEWDITLFTCDSDRSKRILVRCAETTP